MSASLTFADLFSGCGGLSSGFYRHDAFEGALAADHWEAAGKVFTNNHPNMRFELRDFYELSEVCAVARSLKGSCDVLLGGPPCQGFSTLGRRRDGDRRSQLVERFLDVCSAVRPAVVVIENVRGITSKAHRTGVTFPAYAEGRLRGRTRSTSYDVRAILLNAIDYGIAQTRVRWVLIGVRQDLNPGLRTLDAILQEIELRKTPARPTLKDVIGDLPSIEAGEGAEEMRVTVRGRGRTIYNHKAMNHSPKLVRIFSYVPVGGGLLNVPRRLLTANLRRMLDGHYGNGGHIKNIYGRMDWSKPSGTIVAGMDKITCGRFVHPCSNRLLTPRECARIQSFPDSFRFSGGLVTQYYLVGNAVPPRLSAVLAAGIEAGLGRVRRGATHPGKR